MGEENQQQEQGGGKCKVSFQGQSTEVDKGALLIEVTKGEGWPIVYGCEDGMCGTCLVKGDSGLDAAKPKEEATLDAMGLAGTEYRLACQCSVAGDTNLEQ